MFDTPSVFDALEQDTTNQRVASRRALALAHNRVKNRYESFFRGAQSEEEFMERLGLVGEDFDGLINTASAEVGHDHPEHIKTALVDMYRQAAAPPQFVDPKDEEEDDPEGEAKDEKTAGGHFLADTTSGFLDRILGPKQASWTVTAVGEAFTGELGGYPDMGQTEQAEQLGGAQVCPYCGQPRLAKTAWQAPMGYETQNVPPNPDVDPSSACPQCGQHMQQQTAQQVPGAEQQGQPWQRPQYTGKQGTNQELLPWEYQNQQRLQNPQATDWGQYPPEPTQNPQVAELKQQIAAMQQQVAQLEAQHGEINDMQTQQREQLGMQSAIEHTSPGGAHMPGVSDKRNRQYEHIKEQLEDSGKGEERAKEEAARTVNKQRAEHGETKEGDKKHWIQDAVKRPGQLHKDLGVPEGEKIPEDKLEEAEHSDDPKERERAQFAENVKGLNHKGAMPTPEQLQQAGQTLNNVGPGPHPQQQAQVPGQMPDLQQLPGQPGQQVPGLEEGPWAQGQQLPQFVGANNPSEQMDSSPDAVTCPECGGKGKTAGQTECRKCAGKGKVRNFGDSAVDTYGADIKASSWTVVAEEGNTGLGGPEPTINKKHQTPSDPSKKFDTGDKYHPTKEKDIVEPIVMENRTEHDLKEIGEKTTEHEDLPGATGDNSGFSTKNPGGVGTGGTFPNNNQADPVTRATIE